MDRICELHSNVNEEEIYENVKNKVLEKKKVKKWIWFTQINLARDGISTS